ncbi:MAG: hypothetical protein ACJAQT_003192 [Akkermansiaceae bacterium]|jgi:hypothetical protein
MVGGLGRGGLTTEKAEGSRSLVEGALNGLSGESPSLGLVGLPGVLWVGFSSFLLSPFSFLLLFLWSLSEEVWEFCHRFKRIRHRLAQIFFRGGC